MKPSTLLIFTFASLPLVLAGCHSKSSTSSAPLGTSVGGDSQRLFGTTTTSPNPAIAAIGDLNGDQVTDFGVGDPAANSGGGRAQLCSGSTGRVWHTLVGDPLKVRGLGAALAAAGDVDGDQSGDVVIGAPGSAGDQIRGVALLVSGRTGTVLRNLEGAAAPAAFGATVTGLGDANGDRRGDVAIGEQRGGTEAARVLAFSGGDGTLLWTRDVVAVGATGKGPVGFATLHDVDRDGLADLLVAVQGPSSLVLSARDGSVLRNHPGDAAGLAALGDVDGDAVPEYALGFPSRNAERGQVEIVSGATGQVLRTLAGENAGARFGSSIAAAGDRNGDGAADLLVGAVGAARLYSGANGEAIGEFRDGASTGVPHEVRGLGDLDGDGQPDYALAIGGTVKLCSAVPRSLSGDRTDLSVASGGVQQLTLRAGAANAGRTYVFLGTVSGTSPGITFPGNVRLPINPDGYTTHTLSPSAGVHIGFVGALDAQGGAAAQFAIPGSLSTALVGIELWHAGLVLGDQTPAFASNAVPVVFVN